MALIKCRECGSEISSRADSCPHCGAKTRFGMNESGKKELNTKTILLIAVSFIGTWLFLSGLVTMMGDINEYNNSWYGGYNYKSPLSDHEMGVIMKMFFGGVIDVVCSVSAFSVNKKN